jgi:hypothetical protein
MRSLAIFVGLLVPVASCALVVDLDGLGVDSGTPLTVLVPDADADADASRADAALDFCAARGDADTLCADFDEGSLAAGWTVVVGAAADGGIALSDAAFTSPPAAARVIAASAKPGYLEEKSVGAGSVLDLTTDLLLDGESTDGTLQVVRIILLAGDYPELLLQQTYGASAGTAIIESNVSADGGRATVGTYAFSSSVLPGTWTTIAVHIEPRDAGGSAMTVSLGGELVVDQVLAASSSWTAGHYLVDVGLTNRTPAAPVDIAFDNVGMRLR